MAKLIQLAFGHKQKRSISSAYRPISLKSCGGITIPGHAILMAVMYLLLILCRSNRQLYIAYHNCPLVDGTFWSSTETSTVVHYFDEKHEIIPSINKDHIWLKEFRELLYRLYDKSSILYTIHIAFYHYLDKLLEFRPRFPAKQFLRLRIIC